MSMRYELPPLPALQAFEAAARHQSFAAAAEELNLSQSAVSHRVRLLERHLGYPLFERLPRGLRLTESGKAYLPAVRRAFEEILGSTLGIFGGRGEGFVTVRAPLSYTALWLSTEIESFLSSCPEVEVRLISSVWADALAADETDVDLRLGLGHWPGYEMELLFRDRVLPVCSREAAEAGPAIERIRDLARRSLIHVMGVEDIWAKYLALDGGTLDTRNHDMRVDSSVAAAEMAATGTRFALLQKRFLGPYLDAGRLVVALEREMRMDHGLYLVRPETAGRPRRGAVLLREWLLDRFRES